MRLESLEGQVVAQRFRLGKMVGKGGYGAVFEATQLSVERRCALKILLPGRSDDDAVQKRFRAEARVTSRLAHPNSLILYDFGIDEESGFLFLATEFLDGLTVHQALKKESAFGVERALSIMEETAASLDDAHSHGLVHRDVKPKNIMLVHRAKRQDFVKVIDFGIAKVFSGDSGEETGLTRTGMLVGTPKYMAPEQIMGHHVDGRADQYALAVAGYRMLTGRNPFRSGTPMETAMRQLNDRPLPLRTYRPELEIDARFEDVFLRALEKSPESRFDSCEGFVSRLVEAHQAHQAKRQRFSFRSDNKNSKGDRKPAVIGGPTEHNTVTVAMDSKQLQVLEQDRMDRDLPVADDGKSTDTVAHPQRDLSGDDRDVSGEHGPATTSSTSVPATSQPAPRSAGETRDEAPTSSPFEPSRRLLAVALFSVLLFATSVMVVVVTSAFDATPELATAETQDPAAGDDPVVLKPASEMTTPTPGLSDAVEAGGENLERALDAAQQASEALDGQTQPSSDDPLAVDEDDAATVDESDGPVAESSDLPRPAQVTVTLIPWGTLYVNGERRSDTTRQLLKLTPGQHELSLHQNGTARARETVDVAAGQSKMVVLEVDFDQ